MSTSDHLTIPASQDSPSNSSFGPDAAVSPRNLSEGSLHYYSTEDEEGEEPYKIVPIRQVVSSLQEYQEALGIGSEDSAIFPSRLGGPDEMPATSVNAHFPRSGPHRWFGGSAAEKMHPLHGHVFSLYYGPHFRKPRGGWTGNERVDWLRYLWDWRPGKDHQDTTFESWIQTPRAEGFWKRRLRDKACEYYVQYGTVQGTVLEEREVKPREQWEGPTNEFEPDIYVLRNYLKRIELGQKRNNADDDLDPETEEEDENVQAPEGDARSARSDESSDATSSVSSSVREKMRARRMERQWKGIKAPASSVRDPTPDAPQITERRHSALQYLKSALMAAWTKGLSLDDSTSHDPSASGSNTPCPSTAGTVTPQPPSFGGISQGPSFSVQSSGPSQGNPGSTQRRRRHKQLNQTSPNWPFQGP